MVRVRPSAQGNTTSQPNKKATRCQVACVLLPFRYSPEPPGEDSADSRVPTCSRQPRPPFRGRFWLTASLAIRLLRRSRNYAKPCSDGESTSPRRSCQPFFPTPPTQAGGYRPPPPAQRSLRSLPPLRFGPAGATASAATSMPVSVGVVSDVPIQRYA